MVIIILLLVTVNLLLCLVYKLSFIMDTQIEGKNSTYGGSASESLWENGIKRYLFWYNFFF